MRCPSCGSRVTGALALDHFYCWKFCVEFSVGDNSIDIYRVEEDGTLVSLRQVAAPQDVDRAGTMRVKTEGVPVGR